MSGLYAQTLVEMGFLTVAFDPSFTGESGGQPRDMASPDVNTEDFQAAVDYLVTSDEVDGENNRVEQYNTKCSYWDEDERQPRTDGINTGLDLVDALPPVINKTIAKHVMLLNLTVILQEY